jgi:AcrR family transcriptional regulator
MIYRPLDLQPILRCALEAFVEHGYHGTTVRDIARRLHQTVPIIYYYYENKQGVLVALLDKSIDDLLARCRDAEASTTRDPVARLSMLIRCVSLFVAHRRSLALLDEEVRSLEPKNRPAYLAKRDELEQMFVSSIEHGVQLGVFATADARSASRALISMCRGIASWYRKDGPLAPEDLAELYVGYGLGLVGHRAS